MKRKFQIDGISCGGCVARVKKVLDANPAIEKTEISLNPKGATIISMKEELSVDDLQRQLDELGGYTIKEIN
ncbi:MAG: heavy-metal-associated domain-containing protein [Arenibacter algicola]|jgi:copper chaperone CopZ